MKEEERERLSPGRGLQVGPAHPGEGTVGLDGSRGVWEGDKRQGGWVQRGTGLSGHLHHRQSKWETGQGLQQWTFTIKLEFKEVCSFQHPRYIY